MELTKVSIIVVTSADEPHLICELCRNIIDYDLPWENLEQAAVVATKHVCD